MCGNGWGIGGKGTRRGALRRDGSRGEGSFEENQFHQAQWTEVKKLTESSSERKNVLKKTTRRLIMIGGE